MPHKPPINLRELKKTGVLNEKRFYRLLSEKSNYMDSDTAKMFYIGLVKVITAELRQNGIVRLPHLGDFALVKQKDKIGLVGKTQRMIRGAHMLKFYAKRELKDYFSKHSELMGDKQEMDPRSKVLGEHVTSE